MKKLLLICLLFLFSTIGQAQTATIGYIISADEAGLEIIGVGEDGESLGVIAELRGFTINEQYDTEWNIPDRYEIQISPDLNHIAFPSVNQDGTHALFIFDSRTRQLQQYTPQATTIHEILRWSPNSRYLILNTARPVQVELFDTQTEQFSWVIENGSWEDSFEWLPDSERFLYLGDAVCTTCGDIVGYDIYIGDISGNLNPITDLNNILPSQYDTRQGFFWSPNNLTWVESEQRIYFIFSQDDLMSGIVQLYSTNLVGTMRFEYDFDGFYDYDRGVEIWEMFTRDNGQLYLVAQKNAPSFGVDVRWNILQYTNDGIINIVYEKDFLSDSNDFWASRLINSTATSPNTNHIALVGTSNDGLHRQTGILTVINLDGGQVVYEINDQPNACDVTWYSEEIVAYTSTVDVMCPRINPDEVVTASEVFIYNITTGTTQIIEGNEQSTYLIPIP